MKTVQTTIEIDGFIIELEFFFNEFWDDATGENVLCSEFLDQETNIISVSDTEKETLTLYDFTDNHLALIDKWLENNDPIEDGVFN